MGSLAGGFSRAWALAESQSQRPGDEGEKYTCQGSREYSKDKAPAVADSSLQQAIRDRWSGHDRSSEQDVIQRTVFHQATLVAAHGWRPAGRLTHQSVIRPDTSSEHVVDWTQMHDPGDTVLVLPNDKKGHLPWTRRCIEQEKFNRKMLRYSTVPLGRRSARAARRRS
jgi:hypothetical protein